MSIEIKNLSYVYDPKAAFSKRALENVSFEIEDGDFFGIIGHTGSGKSTLVTHFNGLVPVQSGTVIVDGVDLSKKYDKKALRAKVGMVFQYPEYQLFADTVCEDVGFGPKNLGLKQEEIAERVKTAITLVGLDYEDIKNRSPFELSGGQMRRVALAGVIAMNPSILVLDEPTAGLDPTGKKDILNLINSLRTTVKIVVVISHNMDEVAEYCSRVAVLKEGKNLGVFTPSQLFSGDTAEKLGVELPSVTRLARKLRAKGLPINGDVISEAELITSIAKEKGVTL